MNFMLMVILTVWGIVLFNSSAGADDVKKCYHYHYDDHGHIVVIEVYHDIHHPHVLLGYGHFFIDTVLLHSRWHHHHGHYTTFTPHHRIHGFPHHGKHNGHRRHIKKGHKGHINTDLYHKANKILNPHRH